jgi:hypothetical protein
MKRNQQVRHVPCPKNPNHYILEPLNTGRNGVSLSKIPPVTLDCPAGDGQVTIDGEWRRGFVSLEEYVKGVTNDEPNQEPA